MKRLNKGVILALGLALMGTPVWGASIILSIVRTTMSVDEWNRLTAGYEQYEEYFARYAGDNSYRVSTKGDRIDFIFDYPGGWDYEYYSMWKDTYVKTINDAISAGADPGFRWDVRAVGEIDDANNPWREVDWLPGVDIVHDDYMSSPSLGWFWAEDWKPEGGFWAYAYNLLVNWIYFYGDGYYYDPEAAMWYWNWPGSGWFVEVTEQGPGAWIKMSNAQGLPSIAELDDIIKDEMIMQNLPGIAVGVFQDGKMVHVKGYGVTDLETGDPVTTSTIFRWASISKPLTAVAALQLHEANNDFTISDLVTEHAPYWVHTDPDMLEANQITIEHLLSNRSGIHHYGDGVDGPDADDDPDNTYSYNSGAYDNPDNTGYDGDEAADVFYNTGIDFTPGTDYLYSTFGFNLLGSAIDEASPNGYVKWIEDNIADPLGMSSLQVSNSNRTGYVFGCDGVLSKSTIGDQEWKLPGGGWESNVVDLTRFAMGIAEGSLLNDNSRLWTNVPGNGSYCYGINASGSGDDFILYHGGSHGNLKTFMIVHPNQDAGVVVMSWTERVDRWRIARRIRNELGIINWTGDVSPTDECGTTMSSCNGKFAGVWRDTGKDVIIRRGYSHDGFLNEWSFLRDNGYYCDDFEPHIVNGELRWDGIFRKGSGANGIWRNYDLDGFKQKWQEQSDNGMRLVDLETYVINGERRWAGLFRPGNQGYAMWRNFSTSGFADKREEMAAEGLKLIDIEVYVSDGELKWSGVWIEGTDGLLNRNYTTSEFGELWQTRRANGWKLIDMEAYRVDGELYWAGIWEASPESESLWRNWDYCGFMEKHSENSGMGMELIDMEYYDYD